MEALEENSKLATEVTPTFKDSAIRIFLTHIWHSIHSCANNDGILRCTIPQYYYVKFLLASRSRFDLYYPIKKYILGTDRQYVTTKAHVFLAIVFYILTPVNYATETPSNTFCSYY